jgi:hypothetical protein
MAGVGIERVAMVLGLVACLGAQPARADDEHRGTAGRYASGRCKKVFDVTVPDDTQFPYTLEFELGRSDLRARDEIVIKEVLGTRPQFEVGGIYLVRGTYVLDSVDEARLSFTVTATRAGEGCTGGNPRGALKVRRGKGTFEVASPIAYAGYPHIWFRTGNTSAGGVYFGRDPFLKP